MYEQQKTTKLHDENNIRELVMFFPDYTERCFPMRLFVEKKEIFAPTFEQNVTAGLNPLVHVNPNKIYRKPIE